MTTRTQAILIAGLVAGSAFALSTAEAQQSQRLTTAEDIERALMQDLPTAPPAVPERTRSMTTRGISSIEPTKAERIVGRPVPIQIQFKKDSADLTESGKKLLDDTAAQMNKVKTRSLTRGMTTKFDIIGHASCEGDPGYNKALSRRRAEAVREYLLKYWSFRPDELPSADGKGIEEPQFTPCQHEDNRRVNFTPTFTSASASN